MNTTSTLTDHLRQHLAICRDLLALAEGESLSFADPAMSSQFESYHKRKTLLPRLADSIHQIRELRRHWQALSPAQRAEHGEMQSLLAENRDLIMKIIVLDRENEQTLLRRGLLPPRHIPPANSRRPHFVAELYRRTSVS